MVPQLLLAAAASNYTIVADWNAYEVGPERKPPKPAGPVLTNISTLEGCAAHCTATEGCVQFAWNYGSAARRRTGPWYCEISSAPTWGGVPSDHITSGCLPAVTDCGKVPPRPKPLPPHPPGPFTPKWTATEPAQSNSTWGYPLLPKATHTYVYYAAHTFGTYNHGTAPATPPLRTHPPADTFLQGR